ncbi:MAG: hypothetical protein IPM77_06500 [Crocinitomicaceae bacterium]|nr:hypothetical protein [Crocinitomicaceae bacterium]
MSKLIGKIQVLAMIMVMQPYLNAQNDSTANSFSKNTIYLEAFGNAIIASINYDRRVIYRDRINLTVGLGAYLDPKGSNKRLCIPFNINLLFGNVHYANVGIGLSYAYAFDVYYDPYSPVINSSALYMTLKPVGFTYLKKAGGFYFSSGLLIFAKVKEFNAGYFESSYSNFGRSFVRASISVGYSFKNVSKK